MMIEEIVTVEDKLLRQLDSFANKQFVEAGAVAQKIFDHSERKWLVRDERGRPLAIVGIVRKSLMGTPPELWMLLCKRARKNKMRNLRQVPALLRDIMRTYPRLSAHVELSFGTGCRFAEFAGFQKLREWSRGGRDYATYEVTNGV